jgi:hypothetical protein
VGFKRRCRGRPINDSANCFRGVEESQAATQQHNKLQKQDVLDICTTDGPAKPAICVYESIQSEKVMASRFHEDLPEASIQTRKEIQEESKTKVGTPKMDEGG